MGTGICSSGRIASLEKENDVKCGRQTCAPCRLCQAATPKKGGDLGITLADKIVSTCGIACAKVELFSCYTDKIGNTHFLYQQATVLLLVFVKQTLNPSPFESLQNRNICILCKPHFPNAQRPTPEVQKPQNNFWQKSWFRAGRL